MMIFWTILSGVSVYVIGQAVLLFVVHPIHRQKKTIGKVADFLIYYSNRFTNPGMRSDRSSSEDEQRRESLIETSQKARLLASELVVRTQSIPGYKWIERFGLSPKKTDIRAAYKGLIFISNAMFDVKNAIENYNQSQVIEKALGITTEFAAEEPPANAGNQSSD